MTDAVQHPGESRNRSVGSLLNILRAGVLGGQDGIISTAGIVVGVAGASLDSAALLIAGLAGLVSGALSMAGGEYVSVSSQRDTLDAHTELELGIDSAEFSNPWHAAISSAVSFAVGAALPLLAITLSPSPVRLPITFVVVILALIGTGLISAQVGGAPKGRAVLRNVVVGVITMVVTFGIGSLVGTWI